MQSLLRRIGLVIFSMCVIMGATHAQPGDSWTNKIQWSFKVVKVDDNHADIIATGKLKEHWHVFSVNHDPSKADGTGLPTVFKFKKSADYKLIGKLKDGAKAKNHEDFLGTSVFFEGAGVFVQRIEVLTDKEFDIEFEYEFQVCDDMGCLFPPAQEGKVHIKGYTPVSNDELDAQLIKNGDLAKDTEGNDYVLHEGRWIRVPEGNSVEFFRKYLKLGGNYE